MNDDTLDQFVREPKNEYVTSARQKAISHGPDYYEKKKGEKSDKTDCSGLNHNYMMAKGLLETQDIRINLMAKRYNSNYFKLQGLDAQAKLVKDEAISEWKSIVLLEGVELATSLLADILTGMLLEAMTAPQFAPIITDPIAKYIYTGPSEIIKAGVEMPSISFGFDVVQKFYEFYELWNSQAERLNIEEYRKLANKWRPEINVDAMEKMLDLIEQMNSVIAEMYNLMYRYHDLLNDRPKLEKDAAQATAAWEECIRQNQ